MKSVKCAIYVRKSTENGLEQEFNSLNNQEEACKNYILSQSYNGWEHYKSYIDCGISGGTMNRHALKEMQDDIRAGLINIVLVYKVDRLSRSIMDFHRMMNEFAKYKCEFVSITQAFDTSNSMGKLTLNMLLSFAQFEREVSAERVRDKIAASKVKGMWMGGNPPLGYDVEDKKLVINQTEAELIKLMFKKYIELGSLSSLRDYLNKHNFRNKSWITRNGTQKGGGTFGLSALSRLLKSKIYIGKIESKKDNTDYKGNHKGILDTETFNKVQSLLVEKGHKKIDYASTANFLSGKIYDTDGNVFRNQKSCKNAIKKYRYYSLKGKYLPAGSIEKITIEILRQMLESKLPIEESKSLELSSICFDNLSADEHQRLSKVMLHKMIYQEHSILFFINIADLSYLESFKKGAYLHSSKKKIFEKHYITEDKKYLVIEKEIIINNNSLSNRYKSNGTNIITKSENNKDLIKALSYAWQYKVKLENGMSIEDLRKEVSKADRTIYKYMNLNFLSPNIVNDIMSSNVPAKINLQKLFEISSKYPDFQNQEKIFYS